MYQTINKLACWLWVHFHSHTAAAEATVSLLQLPTLPPVLKVATDLYLPSSSYWLRDTLHDTIIWSSMFYSIFTKYHIDNIFIPPLKLDSVWIICKILICHSTCKIDWNQTNSFWLQFNTAFQLPYLVLCWDSDSSSF